MSYLELDTYDVEETREALAGLDVEVSVVSESLYEAELTQVRVIGNLAAVIVAAHLLDVDLEEVQV